MNNNRKILLATTFFLLASASSTVAGTLTVINKIPAQSIQLFIRGEGSDLYQAVFVEPGHQKSIPMNNEYVNGKNTFEVIASTSLGGHPDWKLLGGKCSNLVTNADHVIAIDSLAGKVSCQDITAGNPMTNGK